MSPYSERLSLRGASWKGCDAAILRIPVLKRQGRESEKEDCFAALAMTSIRFRPCIRYCPKLGRQVAFAMTASCLRSCIACLAGCLAGGGLAPRCATPRLISHEVWSFFVGAGFIPARLRFSQVTGSIPVLRSRDYRRLLPCAAPNSPLHRLGLRGAGREVPLVAVAVLELAHLALVPG